MRILVCGDRNWTDGELIESVLREIHAKTPIGCVIEGECRGADLLAREAALRLGIPVAPFPANWRLLGPRAGPIRNQRMLNEGKPNRVCAFHDHIMLSVGTADMIERALVALGEVTLYGHGAHPEQILRRNRFV